MRSRRAVPHRLERRIPDSGSLHGVDPTFESDECPTLWFHGDIASGNLLVENGRLSAVIDFGTSGVGDPACDLVIAWTMFSGDSREAFRSTVGQDVATWARARGWALWKALIVLADVIDTDEQSAAVNRLVIDQVLEIGRAHV